ncbi:MAG TPA: phage BR0599 family protein [Mycobacterium sp.]|nr:phage BR0599 family protein [Mycobacterium sp.]
MASTFDADERSTNQNRPIDLFTIVTNTATYRITSNVMDVSLGGFTYTATTMSRGKLSMETDSSQDEIIVYLPISHPLVQSYCSAGIPEQSVQVTVVRLQSVSGQTVQQATGFAQSLSIDGHTALLRVPSLTNDAFKTQLPTVQATRTCAHMLFDRQCAPNPGGAWPASGGPTGSGGPLRTAFTVATVAIGVSSDGRTYTMDSIGSFPDGWFNFGRIIIFSTGESRMILSQVGTTFGIKSPFSSLAIPSTVKLEVGCDHTFATCVAKFNNQYNFGGYPKMNAAPNPWAPNGLGIVVQT